MAAGRLPTPGAEFGPCKDDCKHSDCAETRSMARATCHYCHKQIGYEVRFYMEHPNEFADLFGRQLVHAICLEEKIEADHMRMMEFKAINEEGRS